MPKIYTENDETMAMKSKARSLPFWEHLGDVLGSFGVEPIVREIE
jgi:hypothetical protein